MDISSPSTLTGTRTAGYVAAGIIVLPALSVLVAVRLLGVDGLRLSRLQSRQEARQSRDVLLFCGDLGRGRGLHGRLLVSDAFALGCDRRQDLRDLVLVRVLDGLGERRPRISDVDLYFVRQRQ